MTAIGGHQSASMLTDVWLTPPELVEALGPFDLDPCAAPEPRPWATATRMISQPDDGLAQPWEGRVWLNPPYSREARIWLARMAEHGRGVALTFARTETAWFVENVWRRATALLFLHGRLHFHHPDGARAAANSGAPSVLIAYGRADADALMLAHHTHPEVLAGSLVSGWWSSPRATAAGAGVPSDHPALTGCRED